MGEWQNIATAPRDGTPLLVWATTWAGEISSPRMINECVIAAYEGGQSDWGSQGWWSCCGGDGYAAWCKPTHWQPLPVPPHPSRCNERGEET